MIRMLYRRVAKEVRLHAHRPGITVLLPLAAGLSATAPAHADRWRWHHDWWRRPVIVAPPPVYYAPPAYYPPA